MTRGASQGGCKPAASVSAAEKLITSDPVPGRGSGGTSSTAYAIRRKPGAGWVYAYNASSVDMAERAPQRIARYALARGSPIGSGRICSNSCPADSSNFSA